MVGSRHDAAPVTVWRRGEALVAHHGDLVGVRWTGIPTSEQIAALAAAHRAARAAGGDVLVINHVAALVGSVRVDARVHAHVIDLVTEARDSTRAVAHVVGLPGPVGAAVRTFLRALEHTAGNGRTSTRTFELVDPAASWLATLDPSAARAETIESRWRAMTGAVAPALAA
jgi:hypothetical protein